MPAVTFSGGKCTATAAIHNNSPQDKVIMYLEMKEVFMGAEGIVDVLG